MRRIVLNISEAERAPHSAARRFVRAAEFFGANATVTTTTGGRTTVLVTTPCRRFA